MIGTRLSDARRRKFTQIVWIIAGAMFLLPSLLGSVDSTFVAIGLMFIIFGMVFGRRSRTNLSDPKDH